MKNFLFLLLLALSGLQLSAQAPILKKNDFFSNSKLRTWYGFNSQHQNASLDAERVISEKDYAELKSLRPMFRDTFSLRVEMIDVDGTQKIVNVSLVLASEFMVAVETWNTACGFQNGKIIIYMEGGCPPYRVRIISNQNGQTLKDVWVQVGSVEQGNLSAGTYKVIVDDSNTPVANNYTLNAAEVKASSSPILSLTKNPEHCNDGKGSIQASAQSGVPLYVFKLLGTNQSNNTGLFQNLKAGIYQVQVVDANFCTDVESISISNQCDSIFSKNVWQKNTCDSTKSLKLDTVKSGKAYGTNTDSFTIVKYNFTSKKVFYIYETTCDPAKVGTFFVKKDTSIYGCDSLLTYKVVTYSPDGDRILVTATTACKSYENRIDTFRGKNVYGCDSVRMTSWIYEGPRTRYLPTRDTCHASPDHIDTLKSLMCADDSIYYVTHFRVLPKDIVDSTASWCKSRKNDTISFINKWGCESFKIVRYLVKPLDTVRIVKDTCYQGSKNSYYLNLKTKDGFCDSVVFVTLNVLKTEVRKDSAYFCGLKKSSTRRDTLFHSLGCPAVITIFDSLAPPAIVRSTVFRYSCDPDSVKKGTYYDTTLFDYGCIKSITTLRLRDAKTTTTLPDTILINQSLDTFIIVSKTLVNQNNCDSIVNRKWIYDKSEVLWLPDSTNCGLKNSEIILMQKFKTHYGSDSVVRQKLIEFPSPSLKKEYLKDNSAIYSWDGEIRVSASGGTWPYTFTWDDGFVGPWRSGLKGGDYAVTLSDKNGCTDSMSFTVLYFWVHPTQSLREVMAEGYFVDCSQARLTFINAQGHEIASIEVDATTKIEVLQRIDMEGVVWVRAECLSGISAGKFLRTKSTFVR